MSIVIEGQINLKLKKKFPKLPKKLETKISNLWEKEFKNIKTLENNKILFFEKIDECDKNLIHVGIVDYKTFFVSLLKKNLGIKIHPIGVSGITFINNNNVKYVILGKRSSNVTQYPKFFEMVPSGHLDVSSKNTNNKIEHKIKLIEEFEEETTLSKNKILDISPIGFLRDFKHNSYDICSSIELNCSLNYLKNKLTPCGEYTDFKIISQFELLKFCKKHKIVPTSQTLAEYFINLNKIHLKPVSKHDHRFLYNLLEWRNPKINISHKKMPTFSEHVLFINSNPYLKWYVIFYGKQKIGTIYLSKNYEIGIFLKPNMQRRGFGKIAIKKLIEQNQNKRFLANINPINFNSQKFFKELGFKLIQHTYELKF